MSIRSHVVLVVLNALLCLTSGSNLHQQDGLLASPEAQEGLKKVMEGLHQYLGDHLARKLQLPPAFMPTRACGESFGIATALEIQALGDVYLAALFPEGSPQEGLAATAKQTLFAQINYDMKLVKVCMTCAEAGAVLEADQAKNDQDKYGFQKYCADGLYGADAVSWTIYCLHPFSS
jgi:hypothetical protein